MSGSWLSPAAAPTFFPLSPQPTSALIPDGGELLTEDGGDFLLEDGTFLLLEGPPAAVVPAGGSFLTEDGGDFLLEDGTFLLMEGPGSPAYSSVRSGPWSSQATWGGVGPPAAGDTAIISAVGSAVSGAANNGAGLVRLTVGSTSSWSTGQFAHVAGISGTVEANGFWAVTVVDGTHLDLQGSAYANSYVGGGYANCVVTVDADATVGSKSAANGDAVTIAGVGSTQYGCLAVSSGSTLTLRGFDTASSRLMLIRRFGLFMPLPGSKVVGDIAADFGSIILNNGRLEAIGTSGSRVAFSSPAANVNWNVSGGGSSKSAVPYDRGASIMSIALDDPAISNLAGNGPGSLSDTSLSFSAASPAGILATEVAGLSLVNGTGKYFVDYDAGCVYLYNAAFGSTSTTPAYKRLDKSSANWKGWGIVSAGGVSGNRCLVEYCDFKFMGGVAGSCTLDGQAQSAPLTLSGHQSVAKAGDATRLCDVKNCTFACCVRWVRMAAIDGTAVDMIQVTGNAFNDGSGGTDPTAAGFHAPGGSGVNFVSIDSNAFNMRGIAVDAYPWTLKAADATLGDSNMCWRVTNNTGAVGTTFVKGRNAFGTVDDPDAAFGTPATPALYVGGNDIRGWGATTTPDTRLLVGVGGTSANPAVVENNHFHHAARLGSLDAGYAVFQKNRFGLAYRGGFTGANGDDRYVTDVAFKNNLFYNDRGATGTSSTSACLEIGSGKRVVANNYVVANNTADGWLNGLVDFNDATDSVGPTLATNVSIVNNVVANGGYAFATYTAAAAPCRVNVLECDFNDAYNQATAYAKSGATGLTNATNPTSFYKGPLKYNRMPSGSRNVPGVSLFDASYTLAQSGRSLVYTVNTLGQSHTLTWGSGTPVQLVYDFGTSAGQGLRTVACTGKSTWAANVNSIRQNWLWVVSGTGAGQARAITWATANAAYAATVASGGSNYAVGQYVKVSGGTLESPGYAAVVKVTAAPLGVATAVQVISGGTYSAVPSNAAATARITGSSGTGLTLNLSWAPGLLLVPDLATAVDSTSVFAIVNAYVQLGDGAGGTVHAGLYLPDPANWRNAVQVPTATATDAGISVVVNLSTSGDPGFPGSGVSSVATDYRATSTAIQDTGTTDDAPPDDYFGTTRPIGFGPDMGFYEAVAGAGLAFHLRRMNGGFFEMG